MAKDELASAFLIINGISQHYMLGIKFNLANPNNGIHLCQRKFTEDILNKYNMAELKPSPIPAIPNLSLSCDMAPQDPHEIEYMKNQLYREMLGSLMYLV